MAKGLYTTVPSVLNAVSAARNDTTFTALKTRWEKDFDLYRMNPYNAGTGYYAYTTNSPYGQVNKLLATLAEAKLMVRVPPDATLTEQDRNVANNVERFIYGEINNNDERRKKNGQTSIREELSWYLALRGSCFIRVFVYSDLKDKTTQVDITPWDSYSTTAGLGAEGLSWACHIRKTTKEAIEDEYQKVFPNLVPGQTYTVYDYWDKANNAVFIDASTILKPFKAHGLDFCPVYSVVAGWMPNVWHEHYTDTAIHRGESLFAGARDIFKIKSRLVSDWLNIFHRGVKAPMAYYSNGGTKTIDEDIFRTEEVAIIPMDSNPSSRDELKPVMQPTMPSDASPLMGVISGEEQQVLFNAIAFGNAPSGLSGFAISNLQEAMLTIVQPYINALQDAYQIISLSALQQFGASSFQPVKVRGRTAQGKSFGMPQVAEIAPKDIDPNWYPEVTLVAKLPADDAQSYNLAALAQKSQLLSVETIQDRLLGVQDTDVENERMIREKARSLPTIMLYNAFLEAQADGRPDIAQHIRLELTRLLAQEGINEQGAQGGAQQPGQPPTQATPGASPMNIPPDQQMQGQPQFAQARPPAQLPPRLQQLANKMRGAGMPGQGSGMPPTVMPNESQGGLPPGAMNASGA